MLFGSKSKAPRIPATHSLPSGHNFTWKEVEDFMRLNVADKHFLYVYNKLIPSALEENDIEFLQSGRKWLKPFVPDDYSDYFPSAKDSEDVLAQKKRIALQRLPKGKVAYDCRTYGEAILCFHKLRASESILRRKRG